MDKLLIAEPSQELCSTIVRASAGMYEVRCCGDGATALSLAKSFQPQVMILTLELPELDGLGVIQALETWPECPRILVTSGFMNSYIQSFLARPSVAYAMLKPYSVQAMMCHVERLCRELHPVATPVSQTGAESLLFHLGVPLRSRSGQCLLAAMTCFLQDPTQAVTKELYPRLARQTGKTVVSVEKAIRQTVTAAWTHRDDRVWRQYFHPLPDGSIPRPTNQQFLQTLAEYLLPAILEKAN